MDIKRGHRDVAQEGFRDARKLTGGGVKTRTLRKLGHPFGRRGGGKGRRRGRLPLLPINEQSGALRRRIRLVRATGGTQALKITTGRGRSNWVLAPAGTRKMVARGFFRQIKKRFKPRNLALLRHIQQAVRNR